jgi:hypothetical protein
MLIKITTTQTATSNPNLRWLVMGTPADQELNVYKFTRWQSNNENRDSAE